MMKNKYKWMRAGLAATAMVSLLAACSDWDDHYGEGGPDNTASLTVWQNLEAEPHLSQFAALVKKSGMDDLLNGSNTFTVWAPENGSFNADSVEAVSSKLLLQQFVENHIARNNYVMSGAVAGQHVFMLNGKAMTVSGAGDYLINSKAMDATMPAKNGTLYSLKGMMPFNYNIYEYLSNTKKYDIAKIDSFYQSHYERRLNTSKSLVGPIVDGQVTYLDSIFDETNTLFTRYGRGYINEEDSSYTMLVPTDKAWAKAQKAIAPYFHYLPQYGATSATISEDFVDAITINNAYLRDSLINRNIMLNLIYNNRFYGNRKLMDAASAGQLKGDSVMSISGNVFYGDDAANLVSGAQREVVSNGVMWFTDSLHIRPWGGWCKPIVIEAENASTLLNTRTGVSEANSTQVLTASPSNQNPAISGEVSNYRYLQVNPGGPSDNPAVFFRVPHALSTTYALFIRLVPENIIDDQIENPKKDSVQLRVFYHRLSDSRMVYQTMSGNYGVSVGSDLHSVVTRYVGDITFPAAYEGLGNMAPVIRVQSRGGTQPGYTNTLRIDALYLVPRELLEYVRDHPAQRDQLLQDGYEPLPIPVEESFRK
jgi:uncharacterized surface protein with fasciclin (FAS1) repeats